MHISIARSYFNELNYTTPTVEAEYPAPDLSKVEATTDPADEAQSLISPYFIFVPL